MEDIVHDKFVHQVWGTILPMSSQGTLHLCLSAYGCLHARDPSLAYQTALTQSLMLKSLDAVLRQSVPEIHHSEQGIQLFANPPNVVIVIYYISLRVVYENL